MKRSLRAALVSAAFFSVTLLHSQQPDPVITSAPARPSPEWLKSGVIYQIFPRYFSPEGNLSGVTARLDDIQHLGVNILWIMPIHPHGELKKKGTIGSPYAVRDYYAIDPAIGTPATLRELVSQAHRRQLKVIIDIVANHTAWDSVLMQHPEYYKKDKQGKITYPYDWSDVAALDYSNPDLRRYMTAMLVHWIKDYDLDGFRCDVASEVPTDFWENARTELERVKPEIIMLAEASKPDLLRKAFDLDYSWPLLSTLNSVIAGGEPATAIRRTVEQQRALFPKGALHMRIVDDHDESRAVTRYGDAGAIAASALILTLDGVPLIYNGMEVGDSTQSKAPALFEMQKIFWQAAEWHPESQPFYSAMIALRRTHPSLQQGELIWIHNSDEQHVVTYLRHSQSEDFLVAVNLSNTPFRGTLEAEPGKWTEAKLPYGQPAQNGLPGLTLDAFRFRIFQKTR